MRAELVPWQLSFYSSSQRGTTGAGVVLVSGITSHFSFKTQPPCYNNTAEYEALLLGLEIAVQSGIRNIHIKGDSQLVVRQVTGEYKVLNQHLLCYWEAVMDLRAFLPSEFTMCQEKKTQQLTAWHN